MSIASRIETIEEHISNIYDTLELGGADLTNVDKNIINIDAEWKNRLKDYLANGIEVIWDNWEKVVGEGTQLNLTPTIKGKMKIDLKGNTKQSILPSGYTQVEYIETSGTQYIDTGYYLNSNNINIKTKIYTPSMPNEEQDILSNQDYTTGRFTLGLYNYHVFGYSRNANNGEANVDSSTFSGGQTLDIELDYNWTTNKKTLIVNGNTTTANYVWSIINSNRTIKVLRNGAEDNPVVNAFIGKMYSMQIKVDNQLKFDFIPCYRNSDNEIGLYDLVGNQFYTNAGTGTFTKGSNAPTPETPVDIQVVSGDNSINVFGLQQCVPYTHTRTAGSFTFTTNEDGTITANGTSSSSFASITVANAQSYLFTLQAGTYTLSGGYNSNLFVQIANNSGTALAYSGTTNETFTLTEATQVYYRAYVNSGTSVSNITLKPMLVKGSVAKPFEAYQSQTYPVNLGNIELCKIGTYQDYISKYKDMIKVPSGYTQVEYIQSSGTQYIDTGHKATNKTQVEAKLYTTETGNKNWFGGSASLPSYFIFDSFSSNQIEYRYDNMNNWSTLTIQNNVVNRDFIVKFGNGILDIDNVNYAQLSTDTFQDTLNLCLFVRNGGSSYISGRIYYFKIYEDNTLVRDFIPCKRNNDNAVGLYDLVSNTFYENSGTGSFTYGREVGSWYKYGAIGKVIFTGASSEGWSTQTNYHQSPLSNRGIANNALTTHFSLTSTNGFTTTSGYIRIWDKTKFPTESDLTTWLGTNNTTLYYALETPTYTQITDNTLIGQLNDLEKAKSYDNQTNVSQVNNDKPFIIDAIALKNI